MSLQMAGRTLTAAGVLFWISWLLMPGVGVTDPQQIFVLVSAARSRVAASVSVQLLSAALYALAFFRVVRQRGRSAQ